MKKFYIETESLCLHPLSYDQLKLYQQNDGSLERQLEVQWMSREIHPELKQALKNALLPSIEWKDNYHFFTLWIMLSKKHNCIMGELCFKGEPCEDGGVEIGYAIDPAFQGKGYITEAVEVLCGWALSQKYVRFVKAETKRENIASQKVLQKNGFVFMGEKNGLRQWQLKSSKFSFT